MPAAAGACPAAAAASLCAPMPRFLPFLSFPAPAPAPAPGSCLPQAARSSPPARTTGCECGTICTPRSRHDHAAAGGHPSASLAVAAACLPPPTPTPHLPSPATHLPPPLPKQHSHEQQATSNLPHARRRPAPPQLINPPPPPTCRLRRLPCAARGPRNSPQPELQPIPVPLQGRVGPKGPCRAAGGGGQVGREQGRAARCFRAAGSSWEASRAGAPHRAMYRE